MEDENKKEKPLLPLEINESEKIGANEALNHHVKGPDKQGYRFSDSKGTSIATDYSATKPLKHSITTKKISQNEDSALECCRVLLEYLNREVGDWVNPILVNDGHIDVEARDKYDRKKVLKIQHTRGEINKAFRKNLKKKWKI